MPFFSLSLNDDPWQMLGGTNFSFLEIGIISVGPIFDVDIVCNGLKDGKSETTSLLNKKLKIGDAVEIIPHKSQFDVMEKSNLKERTAYKRAKAKDELEEKSRKIRINVDGKHNLVVKAINRTTICFNCTWLAKDGQFKLTLGNTNYEDIEQWLQMTIDFEQPIQIVID